MLPCNPAGAPTGTPFGPSGNLTVAEPSSTPCHVCVGNAKVSEKRGIARGRLLRLFCEAFRFRFRLLARLPLRRLVLHLRTAFFLRRGQVLHLLFDLRALGLQFLPRPLRF